ncbi:hypothetical protein CCP3SC15_80042 [Gammaproteobacteria bacterium]
MAINGKLISLRGRKFLAQGKLIKNTKTIIWEPGEGLKNIFTDHWADG